MAGTMQVSRPGARREVPFEELLETAIRKLYPYLRAGRNPLSVAIDGRVHRIRHGGKKDHYYAVYQCFYRRQYEVPRPLFSSAFHADAVGAAYQAIVAAGRHPLIVDCGANIGASVVWFAGKYPAAKIVAIEPAPDNLAFLRQNAAGLDVVVMAGAIGPRGAALRLAGRDSKPLSFQVREEGTGPIVEVFSLRSIVENLPDAEPFILKVDIEGSEKDMFAEEQDVLNRFPIIIVEPHDFSMPGQRVSSSLFAFQAKYGRDFLFANENVFSIDYERLSACIGK